MSNHQTPRHPTETDDGRETAADSVLRRLLHPIVLLAPDRVVSPPSWLEHVPFAFWLMAATRPRVFVELGTQTGNSYAAFAQAARHLGLDTAGYCIDTWKGDAQAGFYDESVFVEWQAYHDRHFSPISRIVRATFDDAARHFAEGAIDLLHVDGYHTAAAVRHDIEAWLPKMSPRGVVVMHDVNVREGEFGAWRVWEVLREAYPSFTFHHGHGLGVLAVGEHMSADVAWLTGLSHAAPAAVPRVREFFARLGETIALRYRAEAAEARLAEARAWLESAATEAGVEHARQHDVVKELEAARHDLTARVEAAEASRQALEQSATELRAKYDRAAATIRTAARDHVRVARDSRARLDDLAEQLALEQRARESEAVLASLPVEAAAAAEQQVRALQGRVRTLSNALARTATGPGSRLSRRLGTLRALGLTPRALVRSPARLKILTKLAMQPRRFAEAHRIHHSRLFDAEYYRRYRDIAAGGVPPLAHFVLQGGREGRAPHPLFDSGFYLANQPDVAESGANPLSHYLRNGEREARQPHPLFSAEHYRAQTGDLRGTAPLEHYVTHGALEHRSPHPLFDPDYYIRTYGQVIGEVDPFRHFVESGAASGFNPHPLFDVAYYRSQVPELAVSGPNPLVHYLQSPASQRRRPHPLFDPAFYLATYKDVAGAAIDPLIHFVTVGGREGRQPIPEFDSGWYLRTYPDVAATGINPLLHYLTHGWLERRNPSRTFDTAAYLLRYPDVIRTGMNPLHHYVEHGASEGRLAIPEADVQPVAPRRAARASMRATNLLGSAGVERTVVCLTHVTPVQPRAGNEYRLHRMLRWLRAAGYTVIPVLAPADGSRPPSDVVEAMADEFGNAVLCPPDGRLEYLLRDVPDVLRSLDGEAPRPWDRMLGEHLVTGSEEYETLAVDRSFCSDALISTVLRLQSALAPYALLAQYIWMSRVLPLVGRRALRIIDTIDVFSNKSEKVGQFGIQDLNISREGESLRLGRADLLIAIQGNERADLANLAPHVPVITTGVDFDLADTPDLPRARRILYVASSNPMNRRGLRDFLRFAWPRIRERIADAELVVAGKVAEAVPILPAGVTRAGLVDDLAPLYRDCRVVINPAVAGTGLKIKTIEALSYLRPIVTWPNGVDGLSPEIARMCLIARDWHMFAGQVIETLVDDRAAWFSAEDRARLSAEGSASRVYAEFGHELERYFSRVTRAGADGRKHA